MATAKHLHAHYATHAVAAAQDLQTAHAQHVNLTATTPHTTSPQTQQHAPTHVQTTDFTPTLQHINVNHVTPIVRHAHW